MSEPLFYDSNRTSKSSLKAKISAANPYIIKVLGLGMIVVIAFSIWFFYPSDEVSPESLPVIYADKSPIRVKPEETDITVTADYNSRIYETFGHSTPPQKIENLLKPQDLTEDPMPREELFVGIQPNLNAKKSQVISITDTTGLPEDKQQAPDETELESSETNDTNAVSENETIRFSNDKIAVDVPYTPPRATPGIFDSQASPSSNMIEITEQETQEVEKTEPSAGIVENIEKVEAVAPTPKKETTGNYYVQLASIQDQSRTKDSWEKLTVKHSDLKNVSYRTESAEIEGKGTFYRIQAGPLTKEAANKLCDTIKKESGSCFVKAK